MGANIYKCVPETTSDSYNTAKYNNCQTQIFNSFFLSFLCSANQLKPNNFNFYTCMLFKSCMLNFFLKKLSKIKAFWTKKTIKSMISSVASQPVFLPITFSRIVPESHLLLKNIFGAFPMIIIIVCGRSCIAWHYAHKKRVSPFKYILVWLYLHYFKRY